MLVCVEQKSLKQRYYSEAETVSRLSGRGDVFIARCNWSWKNAFTETTTEYPLPAVYIRHTAFLNI